MNKLNYRVAGMVNHPFRSRCSPVPAIENPAAVLAAEREMAAWFLAQNSAPGVEVHADSDASWVLHQGMVWANCVANVRFDQRSAEACLDRILRRYRATNRGVGFCISPFATPADLTQLLSTRGLRCRKLDRSSVSTTWARFVRFGGEASQHC